MEGLSQLDRGFAHALQHDLRPDERGQWRGSTGRGAERQSPRIEGLSTETVGERAKPNADDERAKHGHGEDDAHECHRDAFAPEVERQSQLVHAKGKPEEARNSDEGPDVAVHSIMRSQSDGAATWGKMGTDDDRLSPSFPKVAKNPQKEIRSVSPLAGILSFPRTKCKKALVRGRSCGLILRTEYASIASQQGLVLLGRPPPFC